MTPDEFIMVVEAMHGIPERMICRPNQKAEGEMSEDNLEQPNALPFVESTTSDTGVPMTNPNHDEVTL